MRTYASFRVKRKSFYIKKWTPDAFVDFRRPYWCTKTVHQYDVFKGAWNVSVNNSETVGHKDLRLGQIVYLLVFYNISFSWLLPLHGFQFIFFLRDSENDVLAKLTLLFFKTKNKKKPSNFEIEINKETVEKVNSTRFLGLIIDKELFLKQQIKQVETKISKMSGIVNDKIKALYIFKDIVYHI